MTRLGIVLESFPLVLYRLKEYSESRTPSEIASINISSTSINGKMQNSSTPSSLALRAALPEIILAFSYVNFSLFPRPISIIFLINSLPIIWKIIFDPISLLNSLFSMSSVIAANIVESSLFDAKKSRSFSKIPMTRNAVCIWSILVSCTITLTMVECNHLIILNYPNQRMSKSAP